MTKISYSSLSEVWGDASNENTSTENTPTVKYNSNVDNDNKGVNYTGGFNYNSSIKITVNQDHTFFSVNFDLNFSFLLSSHNSREPVNHGSHVTKRRLFPLIFILVIFF